MSEARWITAEIAARRAVYTTPYFVRVFCFTGEGPRPFTIREFPTPGGRRRIQVHEPSFMAWLESLERR